MCANITKIIEDTAIREHKLRKCLLFKRLVLCKTTCLLLFVCRIEFSTHLPPPLWPYWEAILRYNRKSRNGKLFTDFNTQKAVIFFAPRWAGNVLNGVRKL